MSDVQTVLAFDFGLKRIGIAAGDTLTTTAAPRPAAVVHQHRPDWDAIAREVHMLSPKLLVVGTPHNADGSLGALAPATRRFAAELKRRFGLPVQMIDEWGSSLEASAALKAQRSTGERKRRVRKEDIDSVAAAVILERWFNGEVQ